MHDWIQAVVDVLVVVMATILVLFTVGLGLLHLVMKANNWYIEQIKKRILDMLDAAQDADDTQADAPTLKSIPYVRTELGTIAMARAVNEMSPQRRELLRSIILADNWYSLHLHRCLATRSYDKAGIYTKLIADLQLPGFEKDVLRNLHRWPTHADNQEIGLLVLFVCGCHDELVELFTDKSFKLTLSFRSLQELFANYAGDHAQLYRDLLGIDCDLYVTRACIRGIGEDGLVELCPLVAEYLTSENMNLDIDVIRTLGNLGYTPAADAIREYTNHEQWSVRSVAVSALAELEPDSCYDQLLRGLCDPEWWVRFHAAEALAKHWDAQKLLDDVEALDDRYAFEMMRYIIERNEIMKGGDAHVN